jgi:sulfur-oxidizing protein SoxX
MKIWTFILTMVLTHSNASASNEALQTGFEWMTNKQVGNCIACHDLPGVPGMVSSFGPSLKGVGSRLSKQALTQWVVDARKINPNTLMPPFGTTESLSKTNPPRVILTKSQLEQVVDTLASWQ